MAYCKMLAIPPPGIIAADYAYLLEDVRAVVRHELQHHGPTAPALATAPDELLSIREAAELLGVTVQTVHEWKRRGLLKYHKLGSRSYLKRADVLAALQRQQHTAKSGRKPALVDNLPSGSLV